MLALVSTMVSASAPVVQKTIHKIQSAFTGVMMMMMLVVLTAAAVAATMVLVVEVR